MSIGCLHAPTLRVEVPDVPVRLTPPPAVLTWSLTAAQLATPRRSGTALFTRHRKSHHLQLLPAETQDQDEGYQTKNRAHVYVPKYVPSDQDKERC